MTDTNFDFELPPVNPGLVEKLARDLAREAIARGAAHANCVHETIAELLEYPIPEKEPAATIWPQMIARVAAILREVSVDPLLLTNRYLDLIPEELEKILMEGAIKAIRDGGADVTVGKDETGETYLCVTGIEQLGIPKEHLEKAVSLGRPPIGKISTVQ